MKLKFTMLFLCTVFAVAAFGQKPEATVMKADVAPVIDGIEDEVWADALIYDIDRSYTGEVTTIGDPGETNWKALWDDDGIYVLVTVADDVFYPWYAPDPVGANKWQFDKSELYFDVNFLHEDGVGPQNGDAGNFGHYQFAPDFIVDATSGELQQNDGWQNASMVNDPDYVVEYFIPFSKLLDEDGIGVDKLEPIGFDVYIIDNDDVPGGSQQRAVWANIGETAQAWANMDDCGTIVLDGATAGIYVDDIQLEDAVIDENNGMVQIMSTVLPEEATNKALKWSVENGTGRATIDTKGVVTAILDGEVTITGAATDGSYVEATCTVTISNQLVSFEEVNIIKNWVFDDVTDQGTAELWGGWIDEEGKTTQVVEGWSTMFPDQTNTSNPDDPQQWRYQYNQNNLQALPNVDYEFSFVAYGDEDGTLPVDFEDIEGNNHNRYGATMSGWSGDGRSEWHVPITSIPTQYKMDVNFDMIVENTDQKVQFMPGLWTVGVYVDSVYLVQLSDLELITDYIEVESITVSGASSVAVDATAPMSADVLPSDALLMGVRWSVVNGSGEATIDETGMLTGVADGLVTVVATAKDDSGVTGTMDVNVGGTGISRTSVETLKVYPNPAINELNVVLTSENTRVSIYNGVGQKMNEVVVSGTEYRFDISSYAAGIYFVKTETAIAKFVK